MENLILEIANYIEKIGTTNTIIILTFFFIAFTLLLYFSVVLETHLSHSSLFDLFNYGTYEVFAEKQSINEKQVFIVKSMNEISAIEKAAKRLNDTDGFIITARRL